MDFKKAMYTLSRLLIRRLENLLRNHVFTAEDITLMEAYMRIAINEAKKIHNIEALVN